MELTQLVRFNILECILFSNSSCGFSCQSVSYGNIQAILYLNLIIN